LVERRGSVLGHDDVKTIVNRYGQLLPSVDEALADALGAMFDATEPNNVRQLRTEDA
jgi:hypothetical protein